MAAHPSVVYFVQAVHGGPIKIGVSTDMDKRLSQLQSGNPHRLMVLATIQGDVSHEKLLHAQFARSRLKGEWFKATRGLLQLIETVQDMEEARQEPDLPNLPGHDSLRMAVPKSRRKTGHSAEEAVIEHIDLARARRLPDVG